VVNRLRIADDGQHSAVELLEEQGIIAALIFGEADLNARPGAVLALLDLETMSRS